MSNQITRRQILHGTALAGAGLWLTGNRAGAEGASPDDKPNAALRAGAATSNTTLPLGVTNGGVISRGGPATHVHDELHARSSYLEVQAEPKIRAAVIGLLNQVSH